MVISAQDNDVVTVKKENGVLTINIEKEGSTYKIFKENSLVYEGEKNTFSEKMDYTQQKYRIGIFKNDKLQDIVQLNISNNIENTISHYDRKYKNKQDYIGELVQNTKLETIVSKKSVTLNWDEIPDEDGAYEIYKNNEKIGETTETSYTDYDVEADEQHYYTVKVENELTDSEKLDLIEKNKKNISLDNKEVKELVDEASYEGTLSTLVLIPDNNKKYLKEDILFKSLFEKGEKVNKATPMFFNTTYRTYIPFKSVKNLNPLSGKKYLKGDNRSSHQAYSDKFRTKADVYAQLDFPPAIKLWPDVNPTYSCKTKSCSNPKKEGTASTSGIKITKNKEQKNFLEYRVNHKVGIPLSGPYPNIDYGFHIVAQSNSFSAVGSHDKAPNHELWLNTPEKETLIHGYKMSSDKDFWKLIGVPWQQWSFNL